MRIIVISVENKSIQLVQLQAQRESCVEVHIEWIQIDVESLDEVMQRIAAITLACVLQCNQSPIVAGNAIKGSALLMAFLLCNSNIESTEWVEREFDEFIIYQSGR